MAAMNGFLITDTRSQNGLCKSFGDRFTNQYHSVDEFRDWIMRESAGGKLRASLVMILGFLGFLVKFHLL